MGEPNEVADQLGEINLAGGFWKPWEDVEVKAPAEMKNPRLVRGDTDGVKCFLALKKHYGGLDLIRCQLKDCPKDGHGRCSWEAFPGTLPTEPSSAARAVQASEWLEIDARRIDCKFALPTVAGGQHVRKLFVGGLPREANENTLKKHFGQNGKVVNAVVMVNRSTGRSHGFGFVTMASVDSVLTILSTPQLITGRMIDVCKAVSREQIEKEGVNQMDSEDDVQQQQQAYWPAAANQCSVGPQSPVAADLSANVNSAEMATPPPYLNLYHMANIGPGSPQSLMAPRAMPRCDQALCPSCRGSPPPHTPYLPFPYIPTSLTPAHAGQGSPPPYMPYLPLPYISG
eukprot:g60671.t1